MAPRNCRYAIKIESLAFVYINLACTPQFSACSCVSDNCCSLFAKPFLTHDVAVACRRFRDRTNGSLSINDMTSSSSSSSSAAAARIGGGGSGARQRKVYIKKPLNAFMLFMKEMRQKVIDECTLKESAAINQILGLSLIHI